MSRRDKNLSKKVTGEKWGTRTQLALLFLRLAAEKLRFDRVACANELFQSHCDWQATLEPKFLLVWNQQSLEENYISCCKLYCYCYETRLYCQRAASTFPCEMCHVSNHNNCDNTWIYQIHTLLHKAGIVKADQWTKAGKSDRSERQQNPKQIAYVSLFLTYWRQPATTY